MSEVIKPPWTGEWTLQQLSTHPNSRVQAVARRLLGPPFDYLPSDIFTGQLINRLCEFVDVLPGDQYDTSRIQEGFNDWVSCLEQVQGIFFVPARRHSLGMTPGARLVRLGEPWQR